MRTGTDDAAKSRGGMILRIMAAILFFSFAVYAGLGTNLWTVSGSETMRLSQWQYASSDQRADLESFSGPWKSAENIWAVQKAPGDSYVRLICTVAPSENERVLSLRTAGHMLLVQENSVTVYDTFVDDAAALGTGNKLHQVSLAPSSGPVTLDLTLYAPFFFQLQPFLSDASVIEVGPFGCFDLVTGVVLLLLSLALFLAGGLLRREKAVKRQLALTGAACFVCGILAIIAQSGLYIAALTPSFLYRVEVFLAMIVTSLCSLAYLSARGLWNKSAEVMIAGGLIYALCVLLVPVAYWAGLLIRLYALWHGASVIILMFGLIRERRCLGGSATQTTAYMTVSLVFLIYWASMSAYNMIDLASAVYVGVLCFAGIFLATAIYRSLHKTGAQEQTSHALRLHENDSSPMGEKWDVRQLLTSLMLEKFGGEEAHLLHVSEYVRAVCVQMKMPQKKADEIARAALFHDVGKLVVPRKIIEKTETLTQSEFEQIKCHVLYGYQILCGEGDPFMQSAALIARHHHERYDGSGYFGVKGKDIDANARIVAVADVFDALTAKRSYKQAWNLEESFQYIAQHRGTFFDPLVVEAFLDCQSEITRLYHGFENNEEPNARHGVQADHQD